MTISEVRRSAFFIALLFTPLIVPAVSPSVQAQETAGQADASTHDKSNAPSSSPQASEEKTAPPESAQPESQAQAGAIPPKLLKFIEASYPPEALKAGLQAKVELEITVGADGKVTDARVVTSAGHGFDEAALEAARRFVFEPARVADQPVPARVRYPYVFEIREVSEAPRPASQAPPVAPGRIEGTLYDLQEDKPIAGAQVSLPLPASAPPRNSVSDDRGKFAFEGVEPGEYSLRVVAKDFIDFEQKERVVAGQVTSVVYRLEPVGDPYAFGAVARVPPPPREVTRRTIEKEQLTRIAGTRGDPLRTVEIMPGVARPPFSAGQLIVRGSAPADTRPLFEGLPVELLYHFGGLTSFVNPRLVDRIDFYPGNFSVRYGRAIGGIVEVKAADPKLDRIHGVADVNLLDASLLVQTPITEDIGLVLGGRRSYIDFLLRNTLSSDTVNMLAAPVYWDYQAMGTARLSDRDRVRVMAYGSSDRFELLFKQPEAGVDAIGNLDLGLQFHRVHASWSRRLSDSVDQDVELAAGTVNTHFSFGQDLYFDFEFVPIYGRAEWRARLSPKVRVISGIDILSGNGKYVYRGPRLGQTEGEAQDADLSSEHNRADAGASFTSINPAVYLESDFDLKPVRIVLGTRVDYFSDVDQFTFDPRLVVLLALTKQLTLKSGVGLFSQPPQGYEGAEDLGNPHLKPNRAAHVSAGFEYLLTEGVSIGLEGFYKYLFQRVVSTPYNRPPYFINDGTGRVFGLELLGKVQPKGRFFGYLSYTLSRSERRDRDDPWRLFDNDQPHILTASGAYRLGRGWEVGSTFRLVSGNPMTPIIGGINDLNTGNYRPIWGRSNSDRARLFHRLDIRVEKMWTFKKTWSLALYLDLQNTYNAANQEGLIYDYRYEKSTVLTGLPILPVLGLRGEL
jgi:TonB family protein